MSIKREDLYNDFADGKIPTGSQFRALIESIISRNDDGIDKLAGSPLKIAAGTAQISPVLGLSPYGNFDPAWTLSLNANGVDGLNFGQGTSPENPVLFLDRTSGNIGIGTAAPSSKLELKGDLNSDISQRITNLNLGDNAFVALRLKNADSEGVLFRNNGFRLGDGGPNTMTLRNDKGDLRLQSEGGAASIVLHKAANAIGINKAIPENTLDVGGDIGLNGNSIFFTPNQSNVGVDGERGLYWQSKAHGTDKKDYGIYRNAGTWSPGAFQQLRIQFETGIQLGAGRGEGWGYDRSFVEIVNGKGLMVTSGDLGVGTDAPNGKLDLSGGPMMVNANLTIDSSRPGVGTGRIAGEIAGYSSTGKDKDDGFLRLSAGGGISNFSKSFIDLSGNSSVEDMKQNIRFGTAGIERMRINKAGKVGVSTNVPATQFNLGGSGKLINGQGLLLGNLNDPLNTSALLGEETGRFEIGFAGYRDSEPNQIGAKIAAIRIANYTAANPHFIQATELAFSTSTGSTGPQNLTLHETGAERMRINKIGNVGIGTTNPLDLLSLERIQDGEAAFSIASLPTGNNAYSIIKLKSGGIGDGLIFKNSSVRQSDGGPNTMTIRNNGGDLKLQSGAANIWLKQSTGRTGIGTDSPYDVVDIYKNTDSISGAVIRNDNAGENAFAALRLYNDSSGFGVLAKNSRASTRIGGPNGMILHNTYGDLELRAGQNQENFIKIKGNAERIGIGTLEPSEFVEIFRNRNDSCAINIRNPFAGNNAYAITRWINDTGQGGTLYLNSSQRSADGPANAMTLRNDAGDLRLQAKGAKGLFVAATSGKVGLGMDVPATQFHVGGFGTLLDGKGILLGDLNNRLSTTAALGAETGRFEIGFAGWRDSEPNQIGAKIAAVRIANHNSTTPTLVQGTELAFSTSPGIFGGTNTNLLDLSVERMRISKDGYVGIGTNKPTEFVTIFRDRNASCAMNIVNPNAGSGAYAIARFFNDVTEAKIFLNSSTNTSDGGKNNMTVRNNGGNIRIQAGSPSNDGTLWLQKDTGYVGLGTSDPQFPLHITRGLLYNIPAYGYLNKSTPTGKATNGYTSTVAIWANARVVAAEFNAVSDRRIKTNIQPSDGENDMQRFQRLQFADYQYKDFVKQGVEVQKGLIAQEVKEIFPEAVHGQTDFIPDIFAVPESVKLSNEILTVKMEKAHQLKNGDLVQIMVGKSQLEKRVEVIDDSTFKIENWNEAASDLFVYGKQVDDFMVVDYNKVFCLGMSATQEMYREMQDLRRKNDALTQQVQAIRQKLGINDAIFEA